MLEDSRIMHYLKAMKRAELRRFRHYSNGIFKKELEVTILEHFIACVQGKKKINAAKVDTWINRLYDKNHNRRLTQLLNRYVECAKNFLAGEQLQKSEFKTLRQALLTLSLIHI